LWQLLSLQALQFKQPHLQQVAQRQAVAPLEGEVVEVDHQEMVKERRLADVVQPIEPQENNIEYAT